MIKVQHDLETLLGPDRVATDPANRLLYARDMMSGGLLQMKAGLEPRLPDLICWPETSQEVSKILKIANRHRVPLVPYGAGSGVSGGTNPLHGGIMLDLKRMHRIERIEEREGRFYVTAQSGILGQHLEKDLNARGFTLGHFPSSMLCATLGGYLACRSAGQLSSKYGKIEDMVDEIETVLANGDILPFGRGHRLIPQVRPKDVFVGSEGCLGVVTRSRLRIYPLTPATRYRGVSFPNLKMAIDAVREVMQAGLRPAVVRLYDPLDSMLLSHGYKKSVAGGGLVSKLLKKIPAEELGDGFHRQLLRYPGLFQDLVKQLSSEVLLVIATEGSAALAAVLEKKTLEICRRHRGRDLGERPGLHWRDHRYSVSFKMPKMFSKNFFVDTIEVATTWSNLQNLYHAIKKPLERDALVLAHFSHAYPEGCSIYFTLVARGYTPDHDVRTYAHLWDDAMEACLAAGGTISHHHGIGTLKAKYLPRELGGAMQLYRTYKKRLDPRGILNPGKMGL